MSEAEQYGYYDGYNGHHCNPPYLANSTDWKVYIKAYDWGRAEATEDSYPDDGEYRNES